jgi:hypothetical protein
LIKRLTFLVERRGLVRTETPKGLDFSLQSLHLLLVFAKSLFELKPVINVVHSTDQDSQENGAKNDQENRERDCRNDKPWVALPGENKVKHDLASILDGKNDRYDKDQHPKQRLDPSHSFIPPSGPLFSP